MTDQIKPQTCYRMRAFDVTLKTLVFWTSMKIDTMGSDYTGPGPIKSVVVQQSFGA